MNKIKKRKYIIILIILFILSIVFFCLGFREKKKDVIYKYKEDNNIDYRVYLKENSFFETSFLEKNKTYITSLIDYIDSDFNYSIKFNEPVSGSLSYQLIGELKADKDNNDVGNYWTKKYFLSEAKTDTIDKEDYHEIHVNQKIDYGQYNELLNSFVKEYEIQADSSFKVYLQVIGNAKAENDKEDMHIDSELSLTVPLSKVSIEGKINSYSKNNEVTQEMSEKSAFMKSLFKILCIICSILFVYNLLQYIVFTVNKSKYLSYKEKIKMINADYEDIITKVKNINVDDLAIMEVESFDDMINVYNNVKEPVNFLYGNEESQYFIIKGNTCYMYTIKKGEIKRI